MYGGEGGFQADRKRQNSILFFIEILQGTEIHRIETNSTR